MKTIRKFKRTCKKAKGLETRIKREEFLDRLKNPKEYKSAIMDQQTLEILKKIRARGYTVKKKSNPYDPSTASIITKIKRLAGLE